MTRTPWLNDSQSLVVVGAVLAHVRDQTLGPDLLNRWMGAEYVQHALHAWSTVNTEPTIMREVRIRLRATLLELGHVLTALKQCSHSRCAS